MSYHEVLVLITILLTSLVAFYLLYRAKELNLGVLLSISIGAIILGFAFSPMFDAVMSLISNIMSLNQRFTLIISFVTVLFVFMIFILIISFIISLSIPKKIASIDCCIVIDRIIARIKSKDSTISNKDKLAGYSKNIIFNLQKIVKNVFSLTNKLKKPVDTIQKIDTMGIEKVESSILIEKNIGTIDTPDSGAFANLIGFMEPSKAVDSVIQDSTTYQDKEQKLESSDSEYASLVAAAYQETATTQITDIAQEDISENTLNSVSEFTSIVKENEVPQSEILIDALEAPLEKELEEIDANSLVLKAFDYKDMGRKEDAIKYYLEALQHEPNNEMIFWIVLDVCALYKQLGLNELAKVILEGLVSQYGAAIQPEIKKEIMNYLK